MIIPTYRRVNLIKGCIISCINQSADNFDYEIIVVGNTFDSIMESQFQKIKHQTGFVNLKLYFTYKLGVNLARNFGVQSAAGKVLLFLDDDCRLPDHTTLKRVISSHKKYEQFLAIGGGYLSAKNAGLLAKSYNFIVNSWLYSGLTNSDAKYLVGGNVSYKSRVFDLAMFDNTLIYGGTETEFHMRLIELGVKLKYVADLAVIHQVELNYKDFLIKAFKQGRVVKQKNNKSILFFILHWSRYFWKSKELCSVVLLLNVFVFMLSSRLGQLKYKLH